jgi:predicted PurR-regulated permease PerM
MAIQFRDLWNWIFSAVKRAIVPVALAYLIALIIFPLVKYLEKKGIGPRGLSLAIVFILAAGLIFTAFYFITPFVITEIRDFFTYDFPKIITYLTVDMRDDFILSPEVFDQIMGYIEDNNVIDGFLTGLLPSLLASLGSIALPTITTIFLLPIMLIYYLLGTTKQSMKKYVR